MPEPLDTAVMEYTKQYVKSQTDKIFLARNAFKVSLLAILNEIAKSLKKIEEKI